MYAKRLHMHQESGQNLQFYTCFDRKYYSLRSEMGLPFPRCVWSVGTKRSCQVCPEEWRSSQSCRTSSESKEPMASEALTCVTVYTARYGERRHRMLDGHINTSANPNWKKKKKLFSSGTRVSERRMDTLWQKEMHLNSVETQCHTQTATPPCPLVTGWQDGWTTTLKNKRQLWYDSLNLLLLVLESTNVNSQETHTDTHLEVEHWVVSWDSYQSSVSTYASLCTIASFSKEN